jgi:hypothetical protein
MLLEAISHWDMVGRDRRRPARRHQWWNAVCLRDLETERELAMLALGIELNEKAAKERRRAKIQESGRRKPRRHS